MEINEEWNNFMHKVNEITGIVSDLTSQDKEISKKAEVQADIYLNDRIVIMDDNIEIKVKDDKTLINKKACHKIEKPDNSNEMDPETFMAQVSRDAEQRAADKKVRKEKADTFKTRAAKAFRRGEYDTALQCYNKAIEFIRDSCLLYTNRALTLIKLEKYEKVLSDCDWALKLNEDSFKANLYRAKAYQGLEDNKQFSCCYKEIIEKYPQHKEMIDDFLKSEE